jgi:superfamily II DNA or RNA helicase
MVEDRGEAPLNIFPALMDEEGNPLSLEKKDFFAAAPRLGVYQNRVYPIQDLGGRWPDTDRLSSVLARKDLPAFLSLAFSTFPGLELRYPGWNVKRIRPVRALPALLFMEIDRYGYLHVRPLSFLRGFPPLFLENEEIITAVEMDEEAKTLGIAEVVFPDPPEDAFRSLLFKGNRGAAKNQVYEEGGRFIIAPDFARGFLSESILDLTGRFVLLEAQVLGAYKLSFAKPRLRFSLGAGIDYLAGEARVELEGESFSFARFMAEYRNRACITLSDGTRSFPDRQTMERLERLVSRVRGDETVELSYFDIPLLLRDEAVEVEGEAWERGREFFEGYNRIAGRKGSWALENGNLRPYQEYGVRWLDYLREHRMGACLADEMGLGKTIQVIALLRSVHEERQKTSPGGSGLCLILCPKSLVYNWAAELDRFGPGLPYSIHYGLGRDAAELEGEGFRIILSTYATLRRDAEEFQKREFLYLILDESQNIKNLSTQTSAAVLGLSAVHRLALSGTPVENNLSELYSLFRFLNPRFFGQEKFFVQRYLKPIQDSGDEEALRDLRLRIYPFMLRRLKRDVLAELPEKTEETAYIELEGAHLAAYHRRRLEYKRMIDGFIAAGDYKKQTFVILKALSELRRLASVPESDLDYEGAQDLSAAAPAPSAKRQYLREIVPEIAENGHKCLIFTNFLAQVELVSGDLNALGIPHLTMTGATSDRQSLVRRFQTDGEIRAFVMTLKTGGAGLNLTAADYIFILDPWWNRAAETQAIDRSHRIGQANPVFCFRLIARDTIEERILELQQRKADLAGALLADDSGVLKTLSPGDVAYLVESSAPGGSHG